MPTSSCWGYQTECLLFGLQPQFTISDGATCHVIQLPELHQVPYDLVELNSYVSVDGSVETGRTIVNESSYSSNVLSLDYATGFHIQSWALEVNTLGLADQFHSKKALQKGEKISKMKVLRDQGLYSKASSTW